MGRVYATEPAAGELPLAGMRVEPLDPDGPAPTGVVRVEFGGPFDAGAADLHCDVPDTTGRLTPGPVPTRRVVLRAAVRVVPVSAAQRQQPDQPAAEPPARKRKRAAEPQAAFDAPAEQPAPAADPEG